MPSTQAIVKCETSKKSEAETRKDKRIKGTAEEGTSHTRPWGQADEGTPLTCAGGAQEGSTMQLWRREGCGRSLNSVFFLV